MTRPAIQPPVGEVVQLKTARQLTHPAIYRAQDVWNASDADNRYRELTEAEHTFLASVHEAGKRRTETVGGAVLAWGDRTEAYWCVVRLAAAQEKDDLSLALEVFEASVEAEDLLDEIQLALAAE